jgi:hypothetical protein
MTGSVLDRKYYKFYHFIYICKSISWHLEGEFRQ